MSYLTVLFLCISACLCAVEVRTNNTFEALKSWVRDNGGFVSPSLYVAPGRGGYGMFTNAPLSSDSLLVCIPRPLAITLPGPDEGTLGQRFSDSTLEHLRRARLLKISETEYAAIAVMSELQHKDSSRWSKYLDSLPSREALLDHFTWSEDELREAQGHAFVTLYRKRLSHIAKRWDEVVRDVFRSSWTDSIAEEYLEKKSVPPSRPGAGDAGVDVEVQAAALETPLEMQDLLYALLVVWSRSVRMPIRPTGFAATLLPFVDMFNSAESESNVRVAADSQDELFERLCLRTSADVPAHAELLSEYAMAASTPLMQIALDYGILPPSALRAALVTHGSVDAVRRKEWRSMGLLDHVLEKGRSQDESSNDNESGAKGRDGEEDDTLEDVVYVDAMAALPPTREIAPPVRAALASSGVNPRFIPYPLRTPNALKEYLIPIFRLLVASEKEFEVMRLKGMNTPSAAIDWRAVRLLKDSIATNIASKASDVIDDIELARKIESGESLLSRRQQIAVILRLIEKRNLMKALEEVEHYMEEATNSLKKEVEYQAGKNSKRKDSERKKPKTSSYIRACSL